MRVFLPHGMGRTPISMWLLALRLKKAGHRPSLFGYSVTLEPLDRIAARFLRQVHQVLAEDAEEGHDVASWAVIGHSLGNVITRMTTERLPPGFSRFAMLAPPNQSPAVARKLRDNPVFRAITRDAGQRISDPAFFDELPVPDVPMLVVAGHAGPRWNWLPFSGANDSIVQVHETRLDGAEVLELPALHTFLMNRGDVTRALIEFLEHGDPARVVEEYGGGPNEAEAEEAEAEESDAA